MKKTVSLMIVIVAFLLLVKFMNRAPEKTCDMISPQQVIAPAVQPVLVDKDAVSSSQVIGMVVTEKPEIKNEPVVDPSPSADQPKVKIVETMIKSGNQGYMMRDKEYVYFGITKKIVKEVPVK